MSFIEGVEERSLPIRQAILEHPFVRGIGRGDLDVERFKFYVTQDYVYLVDYSRALALGAARAPELEVMSWFAGLLDETLNTEMELHRGYCAQFGITREELEATRPVPSTVAYTSYLLRVASQGSFGELAASLLPCQWGYWEIGEHLDREGPPTHAPLYAEWVGMYSSSEFRDLATYLRTLTDRIGNSANAEEQAAMETAYITSLRLEYQFWDMAWNLEQWPT
ncbi:Aminopyrimidine aminohydrolase [Geodia barretti]|uniref:Aminopyrimidine aminohydrolase n=1 Tax=Geodia barretti TaxID=519541 RepID=A0AA35R5V7_GEOBA|nr:Aminopyrimidine aminohydrolase [Geodia barretti]